MQHKQKHEKCTKILGCISHSIKVKLTEIWCEDAVRFELDQDKVQKKKKMGHQVRIGLKLPMM
jgi:hypothetical protein